MADALRIGGKEAVAPRLLTALFVIVRTPQPVRLGQIVPLREPRTLIGRGRGVGFFLDDASAAEVHAVVTHQETADGPGFYLYASEFNPTRINGMPADVRTRLHDGDRIEIGSTELVYRETALGRGGS
ncbi:MAG: FHA domain-containing protein [Candidatus Eisenbacteria bacterium]|uniref:FHA domain-containing protein n=1 Tax=Eiseniibacteriota bacterium TaxID=2212470 RepID=A0A937XB22_UNCEI|nr:FHA domain-containing protein [Candidatus Eisenbacteria bacterium]